MTRSRTSNSNDKSFPSIVNEGYFSDYFLAYRLDSGLRELYKRWDELEKAGEPTPRTRIRSLSNVFDKYRADASETAPGSEAEADREGWSPESLEPEAVASLRDLNDGVLRALGWEPDRDQRLDLRSGDKRIEVPLAHLCKTATGALLVALDTVFAKDPSTVVADKNAPGGTLLDPVRVNDKPEGNTVLEACQLIFTADDPPSYVLACSGGSITLLDRERWGEGVYLAVDLEEAIARNDTRAKGELAAIAALFGADTINPGEDAESVLNSLLEQSANESAGVSKELRYGVRRSVELLANAVVKDIRERQRTGWTDLDPDELTKQCLRYLYRIIVLLFAEARPELGILPVDEPEYQDGYSLARLRELALRELHSDQARNSTHIQESLALLFRMVNNGYEPETTLEHDARGLSFPGLDSQLFSESACELLDRSRLTDETLQQVLVNLCFSQEKSGRRRQTLSYATLGINQLGAVYEGLMAYKGLLATEELFELDDDGDPDTGTWVIPVDRSDEFPDAVFLKEVGPDGEERRVRYQKGDFVFRLSGRDRQRSASYYTPEVLTEFTVRHALDVYWEEHPDLTAADILDITVCEPALGSGAFLNEAVNQLAARYLKAAQDETGETIDPDQYQRELQKAKAHFAINQCYGVDLNPTAVELAEVSLWLNCMHEGLKAPRYGAHLRRGNSLIGARRATYTIEQIDKQPWKKSKGSPLLPPTDQPLSEVPFGEVSGVHHFLLPGEGWGAPADAVELRGKKGTKGLAEEWSASVRDWRRQIHKKPTKAQLERLRSLAVRVEAAWARAADDAAEHAKAHNRSIDVWHSPPHAREPGTATSSRYNDPEGPAARLRLLMDAWCALWMWAPENGTDLPTFDQWLDAAELLLGQPSLEDRGTLFSAPELDEGTLDSVELFGRASVAELVERYEWLGHCLTIANKQGFFHWELEFPHIFQAGGFDVQVGNPPWVRPRWSDEKALAEHDPWFALQESASIEHAAERRLAVLSTGDARARYVSDRSENQGLNDFLGAATQEPLLTGLQNNLYLTFITGCWRRQAQHGVTALLHPTGHLTDPKADVLRSEAYVRYREAFHFINELLLFRDISDTRQYGVHVYGGARDNVSFRQTAFIYHPSVVDRSFRHDGTGDLPGRKLPTGEWDLRPHKERIVQVDGDVLGDWADLLAYESRSSPPVIRFVTSAEARVAEVIARHPHRLADTGYYWSRGFDEQTAAERGIVEQVTAVPSSWAEVLLQGPHIGLNNPFAKQPRSSGKHQQDYEPWNLESLPESVIPRTNWQRKTSREAYEREIPRWNGRPSTDRFRLIVRRQVPSNTYRSVFAAILPPDAHAMSVCYMGALSSDRATVAVTGFFGGLVSDFLTRVTGVNDLHNNVIARFPIPDLDHPAVPALIHRTLRLNCLTREFADLWDSLVDPAWRNDDFTRPEIATRSIADPPASWDSSVPVRTELDRWLLLTEIDALGALILGIDARSLEAVYVSQFPVLQAYEHQMMFDRRGRQLCGDWHQYGLLQAELEEEAKRQKPPGWVSLWKRVEAYTRGEREVDVSPFEPPFVRADRVESMTSAYRAFAHRYGLASESSWRSS